MISEDLEVILYNKVYKDMAETNSNMEKETRTVKQILAEQVATNSELTILNRKQKQLQKELERQFKIELKEASKRKKNKNSGEKRDPSGFNAKQPVPVEFCEQPWGCSADQQLPRTMLTKMVYDYIKENQLQDPTDKRKIIHDATLRKLFHLNEEDKLHFNNFQTYMKRLYDRSWEEDEAEAESSAASSTATSASESEDEEVKATKSKSKKTKGKGKGKKGKKGKKSKTATQNL